MLKECWYMQEELGYMGEEHGHIIFSYMTQFWSINWAGIAKIHKRKHESILKYTPVEK
jgi:hypothetical protein